MRRRGARRPRCRVLVISQLVVLSALTNFFNSFETPQQYSISAGLSLHSIATTALIFGRSWASCPCLVGLLDTAKATYLCDHPIFRNSLDRGPVKLHPERDVWQHMAVPNIRISCQEAMKTPGTSQTRKSHASSSSIITEAQNLAHSSATGSNEANQNNIKISRRNRAKHAYEPSKRCKQDPNP